MSLWPPDSGSSDQSGSEPRAGRDGRSPVRGRGRSDSSRSPPDRVAMWQLFRDFFDLAERKRRRRIADDIPWDDCNRTLKPVSPTSSRRFAPSSLSARLSAKILPKVRHSKWRTWFYANWGYEESKHSIALSDWLLKSGHQSEEYMADLDGRSSPASGICRTTTTSACSLRHGAGGGDVPELSQPAGAHEALGGDPALEKLLGLPRRGREGAPCFFRDCLRLYLDSIVRP